MGIGNELNGDDGIGNVLAKEFSQRGWHSIACETVPENFTSIVERERPETLVIVDAADMGIAPGELRIIPHGKLGSAGFGTHGIPLSNLVSHLRGFAGEVVFIGIQPHDTELGSGISPQLESSKNRLIGILKDNDWGSIERL